MLKKLVSLISTAALLAGMLAGMVPLGALAEESTAAVTTVYSRTFEDGENYIHGTTADTLATGTAVIVDGDNTKVLKLFRGAADAADAADSMYFSEAASASSGLLHISMDYKVLNTGADSVKLRLLGTTGEGDVTVGLAEIVEGTLKPTCHTKTATTAAINASYNGTYTDSAWTGSATSTDKGYGNAATAYNTLDCYIDMTEGKVIYVTNGWNAITESFAAIGADADNTMEALDSIKGFQIYGGYTSAENFAEIYCDNITAEVISNTSLTDYKYLTFPTLAQGGIQNVDFEDTGAGVYTGNIIDVISKDGTTVLTKAAKLKGFRYDLGETYTKDSPYTLHVKYTLLMQPSNTTMSGVYGALALYRPNNTASYYYADIQGGYLKNGSDTWQKYNADSKYTFAKSDTGSKITVDAYIDLSTGYAAVKYGDADYEKRAVPTDLINNGISYLKGFENNKTADTVGIDDLTVEKCYGNLDDQRIVYSTGTASTTMTLPSFNDYEDDASAVTVASAISTNNKADVVTSSESTVQFDKAYTSGKLYIGFDYAETETRNATSERRVLYLFDGSKNYIIMGVANNNVGLANNNAWNPTGGAAKAIERTANTWSRIDLVFDFEAKKFNGYLNGVIISTNGIGTDNYTVSTDSTTGVKTTLSDTLLINGVLGFKLAVTNPSAQQFYVDNLSVRHSDSGISASVADVNANYVDVEFSTSLKADEMTQLTAVENWGDQNITSVTQLTQSRIRVNFDAAITQGEHTLTLPAGIVGVADMAAACSTELKYSTDILEKISYKDLSGKMTEAVPAGSKMIKLNYKDVITSNPIVSLTVDGTPVDYTVGYSNYVCKTCYG